MWRIADGASSIRASQVREICVCLLLSMTVAGQHAPASFSRFGTSVADAGDVDRDGMDDWVISDPTPGRAWIVSGRDSSLLRTLDLGLAVPSQSDPCVAGLGDVDGDGVADVGLATRSWDEPSVAGVFSGRDGTLIRYFQACSLAGVGDLDDDGFADVLVVQSDQHDPDRRLDRACLCSGRTGEVFWETDHTSPDWSGAPCARQFVGLEGSSDSDVIFLAGDRVLVLRRRDGSCALSIGPWRDMTPQCAAGAGDVDGDGCGDLAVGYVDDSMNNGWKSCVQTYSSRTGSLIRTRTGEGGYPGAFGDDVDRAGDVDGDGRADVLVTTHSMLEAPNGIVMLSGRNGRVLREILPDLWECHRQFCVRSVPDIDGDGVNEVLAGITPWNGMSCADGLVRVYSGRTGEALREFRRLGPGVVCVANPGNAQSSR
jgi:hypothetical protein